MSQKSIVFVFTLFFVPEHHMSAELFIVKDGQPRAEIIIAEKAPRATRLAAQELQTYVKKISGAQLSIGTEASATAEVPLRTEIRRAGFPGYAVTRGICRPQLFATLRRAFNLLFHPNRG